MKTTKENLIIITGFGTNSEILSGLVEYLSGYFKVFFIDLPGFSPKVPPLPEISLENYCRYAQERIDELSLEHFLIAGVSLGFAVVSSLSLDKKKCLGVLGMGPYLNRSSVNPQMKKKMGLSLLLLKLVCRFKLYRPVWRSGLFGQYLEKISPTSKQAQAVLRKVDPGTFFETAKLIFECQKEPSFGDIPYVLLMNPEDDAIDTPAMAKKMTEQIQKLLLVKTDMEHYPSRLTKAYFQAKLPPKAIGQIMEFIRQSRLSFWAKAWTFVKKKLRWPLAQN